MVLVIIFLEKLQLSRVTFRIWILFSSLFFSFISTKEREQNR